MNHLHYLARGGGARGGGFGGRSSFKSSSPKPQPKPSSPKQTTTKTQRNATNTTSTGSSRSTTNTTKAAPAKPKPSTRPSSATTKTTTARKPSATTTSATGKKYSNEGYVVGSGYQPRFANGYHAPANSVVYYPQHDMFDYMLLGYILSSSSPRNDQVVIVQPDGKEVTAKPDEPGVDGLLIFNWIMLIIVVLALIAGLVWLVNKYTNKQPAKPKSNSFGSIRF